MRKLFKDIAESFGGRPSPWSLLTLLAAVTGGYLAHRLHVPLAWILGPLVITAICSIAGFPVFAPVGGRRLGQIAIGSSIGLNITAAVALLMLIWLPVMVVTAIIAVLIAAVVSVPFASASRIDRKSAYYAMMPGGLSEMANLGAATGAHPEPIAVTQALRVALLVLILPPLIVALDIHGTDVALQSMPVLGVGETIVVVLIGGAGVALARLLRLNNPWMIGALVTVGAATASGLIVGRLPLPLFWLGQFLIGISVGTRFKRDIVLKLPRVFLIGVLFIVLLAALLFGYAALLSWLTALDLASATLGASPGGFAEMAITAQTLHLSVGLVTGFHAIRALVVNGFSTHMYVWLERLGVFNFIQRVLGLKPQA